MVLKNITMNSEYFQEKMMPLTRKQNCNINKAIMCEIKMCHYRLEFSSWKLESNGLEEIISSLKSKMVPLVMV